MSLYNTLYVRKNAEQEEIKEVYQKLALDFHPDRDINKKTIFLEISEAYRILNCKEKRSFYNFFGQQGLKLFTNESTEFLYSKILSLAALKLFLFTIVFFLFSFGTFPFLLALKNHSILIRHYHLCTGPFWISYFFLFVYAIYAIFLVRKNRSKFIRSLIVNVFFMCVGFFLILFVVVFGFVCIDHAIKTSIFHMLPFVVFISVLLVVEIVNHEKRRETHSLRDVLFRPIRNFLCRFFIFVLFFIDFKLQYKFLLCVLFVVHECCARAIDNRITILGCVVSFFYLGTCATTFLSTKIPMYICFAVFYVVYFGLTGKLILYTAKNIPRSKFLKMKMLTYNERYW